MSNKLTDRRHYDKDTVIVNKKLPYGIILALLLQAGGAIWWGASMSASIETLQGVSQTHVTQQLEQSHNQVLQGRIDQNKTLIGSTNKNIDSINDKLDKIYDLLINK